MFKLSSRNNINHPIENRLVMSRFCSNFENFSETCRMHSANAFRETFDKKIRMCETSSVENVIRRHCQVFKRNFFNILVFYLSKIDQQKVHGVIRGSLGVFMKIIIYDQFIATQILNDFFLLHFLKTSDRVNCPIPSQL